MALVRSGSAVSRDREVAAAGTVADTVLASSLRPAPRSGAAHGT
eukprot:COSAG02_NODE_12060_length_1605_cov_1.693227_2_plen_43_part_01